MTLSDLKSKLAGARKSWTVWLNGIVLALVPFLPQLRDALQENLPTFQSYLTPKVYLAALVLLALINMALRFKTNGGLESK